MYVNPSVTQYLRLNRLSNFHEILLKGTSLQVTEPLYCENRCSERHIILCGINKILPVFNIFYVMIWIEICIKNLH